MSNSFNLHPPAPNLVAPEHSEFRSATLSNVATADSRIASFCLHCSVVLPPFDKVCSGQCCFTMAFHASQVSYCSAVKLCDAASSLFIEV